MNNNQFFNLKNGVRGVIIPIPGLRSVTIEVFMKIGSKYETKGEFGMSHFLEHMAFKGTSKRLLPIDINKEIDAKGAQYNASTGHELTSYYITTVHQNIDWAAELLSDILFNSTYPTAEVEKERGVIIEEIRMYKDNPLVGLAGDFVDFLLGKSKIGCWNIAGEVEDIVDINRQRLIDYQTKFFNPKEMVVVISGNTQDTDKEIIEKYFANYMNSEAKPLPQVTIDLNGDREKNINKEIEQAHFCMGVPSLPWIDPRRYELKLLEIIMCGNTSSRLFAKIREENAWAYYVKSVSDSFKETGIMAVQSGVKSDKLSEALDLTEKEMMNMRTVSEEELKRAKEYLNGKLQLLMDETDFVSGYWGQKVLLENKIETIESELKRYQMITLDQVKNLAEEIFDRSKLRSLVIKNR